MKPIAVFGITGRMGQALVGALQESSSPIFALGGAIASPTSARLGRDAAASGTPTGVLVTGDAALGVRGAAVAVDFSLGDCIAAHASVCAAAGVPILVGATGLNAEGRAALERAARDIAVLIAPNTSVGVGLAAKLVSLAAAALGPSFDVEITEAHHRMKRDAPSGTALALAEAVARARGQSLSDVVVYDRAGATGPRRPGSIGISCLRAGEIIGDHTVTFASAGERVEITHRATDRLTFARGALRAAEWLLGRPAGLYGMEQVLGL